MNSVSLIGRLTRDPEMYYSGRGKDQTVVGKFTLAVDNPYKKSDSGDDADFIRITSFGKTAEFAEKYFSQGMRIGLNGRIQTGSYEDKETGNTVYTTEVVANQFFFADSKHEESDNSSKGKQSNGNNSRGKSGKK
jgi:single-strand DNA-binding protein